MLVRGICIVKNNGSLHSIEFLQIATLGNAVNFGDLTSETRSAQWCIKFYKICFCWWCDITKYLNVI